MKMSVVLLTVFGLIAAVCAAVLVQTMARRPASVAAKAEVDPDVSLLVASKPLKAMTVVDSSAIVTKTVRKSELPAGAMRNSVQVVGKVLTRPMVEGEVFAPSCFANDGLGLYLAASLPPGMRAFSISLRDHSGMAGILYPGSVVDILVSLQTPGGQTGGVATTLLQGIQVMGIGSQTVTSDQEFKDKNPGALSTKGQTNTRMVTLLVTPKQAEILQLATQYGTVALTMRNPLDNQKVAQNLTKLSEFTSASQGFGMQLASLAAAIAQNRPQQGAAPRAGTPDLFAAAPTTKPVEETNPLWEMLVVRGNTSEKRTFPLSEVNDASKTDGEAAPPAPQGKPEPAPAASIAPVQAAKG